MKVDGKKLKYRNSFYSVIYILKFLSKRRRRQLYKSFIVILLASFAEIFSIYFIFPFINILFNGQNYSDNKIFRIIPGLSQITGDNTLFYLGIILCLVIISSSILRLINLYINISLTQKICGDLSANYFENLLHQDYSYHVENNSSKFVSDLNDNINGTSTAIDGLLQLISNSVIVVSIIVGLCLVSFKATFISLSIFGLIYIILISISRNIFFSNSKFAVKANALRLKFIKEGLGAIREIILDSNQNFFIKNFEKIDRKLRKVIVDNSFMISSPRFIFEGITLAFLVAFSMIFFKDVENKNFISYIAVFGIGAQKTLPLLQNIYRLISNIRSKKYEVLQISNLLEHKIEKGKRSKKDFYFENIFLKNVSFKYLSNEENLIKNINFEIKRGERIGLVGVTGCGKTTLIDLIIGLLKPTNGNIFINGNDLHLRSNREFLKSWRNSIANVPQNIFISDASFSENIAFGFPKKDIDMERVKNCAELANLSKFIEKNISSYDDNVGEGGIKLSGGQKQRLGIARALYKNSEVLILDEATSALDMNTELNVVEAIKNISREKTILMITHRLSTLKYCDRVIEIRNGKIYEKNIK